jgi:teichuronic acid exporter
MDDEPKIDAGQLQRKARLGIVTLVVRTAALQLAILAGKVYLARVLGPADFGAFWVVQHVLSFFILFGDAGLGAALVQKKEQPTQRELSTVWWCQLAFAVVLIVLAWTSAPFVLRFWPDLPHGSEWLMRALSLEMLLTVLRVIPAILMERDLQYGRLSAIDVLGTVIFYLVASILARRLGMYALVIAILVSGCFGTAAGLWMRPWFPSFSFDRTAVRRLLGFGLKYQAKNFVGFLNAAIVPIYGGSRLGRYGFGLVSWSQTIANFPLQLGEIISRVNFPLFSRLQTQPQVVAKLLARAVLVCALTTYLFIGLYIGLGPRFVEVIWGPDWVPAVPTLYVFSAVLTIGFLVPVVASALDALGRPGVMMRLGIFWTALNWVIVIGAMQYRRTPLVFALAYAVHIVVGNAIVLYVLKGLVDLRALMPRLLAGIASCAAAGFVGMRVLRPLVVGPWSLALCTLLSFATFALVTVLLDRQVLRDLVMVFKPSAAEKEATA